MTLPSSENIQAALDAFEQLPKWKTSHSSLKHIFRSFKANKDLDVVVAKVAVLDRLYFTRLRDPIATACHIVRITNLDLLLEQGNLDAVDIIAKRPGRREFVFASKFAHFHNQSAYPIIDKYAYTSVWNFLRQSLLAAGDADVGERRDFHPIRSFAYCDFVGTYECVLEVAGLLGCYTWEQLDRYMWLYGLKHAVEWGDKQVNREFVEFYRTLEGKGLLKNLEPE